MVFAIGCAIGRAPISCINGTIIRTEKGLLFPCEYRKKWGQMAMGCSSRLVAVNAYLSRAIRLVGLAGLSLHPLEALPAPNYDEPHEAVMALGFPEGVSDPSQAQDVFVRGLGMSIRKDNFYPVGTEACARSILALNDNHMRTAIYSHNQQPDKSTPPIKRLSMFCVRYHRVDLECVDRYSAEYSDISGKYKSLTHPLVREARRNFVFAKDLCRDSNRVSEIRNYESR